MHVHQRQVAEHQPGLVVASGLWSKHAAVDLDGDRFAIPAVQCALAHQTVRRRSARGGGNERCDRHRSYGVEVIIEKRARHRIGGQHAARREAATAMPGCSAHNQRLSHDFDQIFEQVWMEWRVRRRGLGGARALRRRGGIIPRVLRGVGRRWRLLCARQRHGCNRLARQPVRCEEVASGSFKGHVNDGTIWRSISKGYHGCFRNV